MIIKKWSAIMLNRAYKSSTRHMTDRTQNTIQRKSISTLLLRGRVYYRGINNTNRI
jgi:hypothetical protein